jgi:hypothetical protein
MSKVMSEDGRSILLSGMRLSFAEGIKDKKIVKGVEGGTPKYNFNLINETDGKNFKVNDKLIIAAMEAAGEVTWKKKNAHEQIFDDNPKRICYKNGNRFKSAESGEIYAGYEGNKAMSCGTPGGGQKRPKLMDRRKRAVSEEDILDVFYSGCYVDAVVSFFGTDKGGKGIFCTVDAIRSHEEGERLGGGGIRVEEDDFDDLEESAGDDDMFD